MSETGHIQLKRFPNLLTAENRTSELVEPQNIDTVNDLVTDGDRMQFDHVIHSRLGPLSPVDWEDARVKPGDEVILTVKPRDPVTIAIGIIQLGLAFSAYIGAAVASNRMAKKANTQDGGTSNVYDDSRTYGWEGIETIADVGVPVPVIYGDKNMVGGNVISQWTSTEDDNNVMHLLLAIGEGTVKSIAGLTSDQDNVDASTLGDAILINGNPISNYKDVTVSVRLGSETQDVIPGFESLHEQFPLTASEIICKYGEPDDTGYVYTTSNEDLNAAVVHLGAPDGLYRIRRGTKTKPWSINFKIEYREHFAAGAYTTYGTYTIGPYQTQTVLRRRFRVNFPSPGKYDIRITRTNHDPTETPTNDDSYVGRLQVTAVDEVHDESLTYPFTALLAVDALATEQFSGRFPNLNIEVEGLVISDWVGSAAVCSNNPIVQRYDFLTNTRYGVGDHHVNTLFDNTELTAAEAYCDVLVDAVDGGTEPRFETHCVIDGTSTLLDFLLEWDKAFRGITYYSGNALMVTVDRPGTIEQNFGDGALKHQQTQIEFNSRKQILNTVEVQFQNSANSYQREPALVEHSSVLEDGDEPIRELTQTIPLIKSAGQAVRIARYLLLKSRLSTKNVRLISGMNAVACQAHQVVGVAHHMPSWGLRSGRVRSGAASTFTIYEKVTIPTPGTGETIVVTIQHEDDTIETQEITSAPGEYVGGATLSIAPATFTTTPSQYETYSIGVDGIEHKPFRVQQLQRKPDGEVGLFLTEYDEDIYDETNILADILDHDQLYTNLPDPRRPPDSVTDLDSATLRDYNTPVQLSWTPPLDDSDYGFYEYAEVYVAEVDDDVDMTDINSYEFVAETRSTNIVVRGLEPGREWRFVVRSVSRWRVKEAFDSAATVDVIPLIPVAPPAATGLELIIDNVGQGNSVFFYGTVAEFRWRMPTLSTGGSFHEHGEETYGVGQGITEEWFSEFWVNIWDRNPETDQGEIIRQVRQREPYFRYTEEMNKSDHGGVVDRQFGISIRVVDRYVQLSPHTAISVWNPVPDAIITHHTKEPTETRWHQALTFYVWDTDKIWCFIKESSDFDVWGYRLWRKANVTTNFPLTGNGQPDITSAPLWQNTRHNGFIEPIPTGGNTVAFMIAAVDHLGRERHDEDLNFTGHIYIDDTFDGSKDAAGLWTGVHFVEHI